MFTDEQRRDPAFPFSSIYSDSCFLTNVFDFQNNNEVWVPHPFVALRDGSQTGVPTSSGLAAGPTALHALLRAIQELIERDALMMTWLHSVPARSIQVPSKYADKVTNLGGEIWAFDVTPMYSPFPVIAVAGGVQKRGKWRYSLGIACQKRGLMPYKKHTSNGTKVCCLLGFMKSMLIHLRYSSYTLKSFDEHAIFYTLHPELWHSLPMFRNTKKLYEVSVKGTPMTTEQALKIAKKALQDNKIRLFYRDLTTIDADQLGIRVVRAT